MTEVIPVPLQSLAYSVNRTGAKTVPCCAPVDVHSWDGSTDWKQIDWVIFSKKCTNQSVNLRSISRPRGFLAKTWGCVVLKTEEKKKKKKKSTRLKNPDLCK